MFKRIVCAKLSVLILALHMPFFAFASEDSGSVELSEDSVESLYVLAKVWGFLKYHHPSVIAGCREWDSELLELMPEVLELPASKAKERIYHWVRQLNSVDNTEGCSTNGGASASPRTRSWLTDKQFLGARLSEELVSHANVSEKISRQHYVVAQPGVGNAVFNNEGDYSSSSSIDWELRLLGLFRFWNIVEYWAPYRELIGNDFDKALIEFIPLFYDAEAPAMYENALMRLAARIEDGHTNVWSLVQSARPPMGEAISPFAIRFIGDTPTVWRTLPFDEQALHEGESLGLKVGDEILAVDNVAVEQLVARWAPYYGVSNEVSLRLQIAQRLLRGAEGAYEITVSRGGSRVDVTDYRLPYTKVDWRPAFSHDLAGEAVQFLEGGIPYLKPSALEAEQLTSVIEAAIEYGGLIIDLRGYPKSFIVFSLGQHLVDKPTPFARFTVPDISTPGTYRWTDPLILNPVKPTIRGGVAILVDETTMSQAEYTAMAFRVAERAAVIGSQTAGADGNVSQITFPGGHSAAISGIGVFYPDKSPTQQVGIRPDIEVRLSLEAILQGVDPVLDAAIKYVQLNRAID